jgi:ABC-type nitrate/sulfonate/bicarbonate transport system substrate-binding protein
LKGKTYVAIAAVAIVILILGSAFYSYVYLPSLPKELQKFKLVAGVPPNDGYWELPYASDMGIYREEGLEVELLLVRTPTEMMQALVAGDADAAYSIGEAIGIYLGGSEQLRIVSVTMRPAFALWVKPEINSIQEVKSIAVSGRGAAGDVLLREYLLQHGLTPEVDVALTYTAVPATLPAFLSGQVDAFVLGTSGYPTMKDGSAKILTQFAKEFPKYCMGGIAVAQKSIAERPQVVKAFVKALYRSQVALIQNKQKAIEYAVNVLKLDKNYATFVYEFAYEGKYGAATKMIPDMPVGDLEYTLQITAKYMSVPTKPIEGCVDTMFMDQVKKELG